MSKLRESKLVSMVASGIVAAFGVAVIAFATTISSNISTGGTLSVTGASTLTGAVSVASTLGVTATSTFTGDAVFNKGVGLGADNSVAKTILFSGLASAPDSSAGRIYYNSSSKLLQLYDGTQWANIATSTGGSGIDVSGSRMQLNSLSSYLTIGTTTQQGLSVLTLEATGTAAIPLTLVVPSGQTANMLQLRNSASTNMFYVDSSGGFVTFASSTAASHFSVKGQLNASSTLTADGNAILNGNITLGNAAGDAIILTGNASTTNSLTVGGNFIASASSTVIGNFNASGRITAGASSTPAAELGATGSATTTVYLTSSGTNTGGCIQLLGANGTNYRMYIGGGDTSTTTTNGHQGIVAVWEAGACK